MKLLFILVILGLFGYSGRNLSKRFSSFHKRLTKFISRFRYPLLILLMLGLGSLIFMAYYTSAVDRHCITTHTPTTEPPTQFMSPADYVQQGDYEYERGNCLSAIADYSQAIVRNLSYVEAYNNRAYANMRMRNFQFALMDLDQAITLRPDYVNALVNRGDIYNHYYQIDKQKAIADYDRVIALERMDTAKSVCGHRAVAMYGLPGQIGWNILSYLQLILRSPTFGCTMQAP